jgi:hypothetical protein
MLLAFVVLPPAVLGVIQHAGLDGVGLDCPSREPPVGLVSALRPHTKVLSKTDLQWKMLRVL